jgi:hypothetical protein
MRAPKTFSSLKRPLREMDDAYSLAISLKYSRKILLRSCEQGILEIAQRPEGIWVTKPRKFPAREYGGTAVCIGRAERIGSAVVFDAISVYLDTSHLSARYPVKCWGRTFATSVSSPGVTFPDLSWQALKKNGKMKW